MESEPELCKHLLDMSNLNEGVNYKKLKYSYIICLENPEVKLNDGTHKVFFNAKNSDANDDFTNTLKAKVSLAKKNMEWRNQYMTWQQMIDDEKDDAREEGRAEGRTEGAHKAKIETARILKHSGVDLSLIQKATGLTSDQINEL